MAKLEIPTTVQGPDNIEVELVRADYLGTSGEYRTFFEVSLALSSCFLGVNLSIEKPTTFHWISFIIPTLFCVVFLLQSIRYNKKSKDKGIATPPNTPVIHELH